MTRAISIAAVFGLCAALLTPTTASAVCECYKKGAFLRCQPSKLACRWSGGTVCYEGCRTGSGPG